MSFNMRRTSLSLVFLTLSLLLPAISTQIPSATAATCPASLKEAAFALDGVNVSLCSPFLPAKTFTASQPDDVSQVATSFSLKPYREFSVTAIPYGAKSGTENLGIAKTGSEESFRQNLQKFRRQQGAEIQTGPAITIFGKTVSGYTSQVKLPLDGEALKDTLVIEWVIEAGQRIWIVRVAEELPATPTATRTSSKLPASFTNLNQTAINSPNLNNPSTSAKRTVPILVETQPRLPQPRDLPTPYWWTGDCDTGHYSSSYRLGATYLGTPACGPRPAYGAGDYGPVTFPGGWGEYEWECVEFSMRVLYLAYGVNAYSANGSQVVSNYNGSRLQKISNGTNGTAPQPGDVLSYGPTTTDGHTSVVSTSSIDGSGNGSITVIEENYSANGTQTLTVSSWVVQASPSAVTGWLHDPVVNPPSLPAKPYGLGVTTLSSTEAQIMWGDAASNETGFKIERRPVGATAWTEIAQTGANVSFYDDKTLLPAFNYEYRVQSYNSKGNSDYSNTGWTGEEVPVYRFYSQLSDTHFLTASAYEAYYTESHSDTATWYYEGPSFWVYRTDDCGNGRSPVYRFYLKSDTRVHFYTLVEHEPDPNYWTEESSNFCAYPNQVTGSQPIYRLRQTNRDTNHLFTISANEEQALVNSGNWIYEGNPFYARVKPIPGAPYNLGVTRLNDTSVQLTWGDNSSIEDGYKVERMTGSAGSWSEIAALGPNQVFYTDNTLSVGQIYYYRVRSYNAAGFSPYTTPASNTFEAPVYRFYSQTSNAHFYTSSSAEANYIQTHYSLETWHYEQVAFYAYRPSDCSNKAPVYRFYLKTNSLEHFYTLNENEPSKTDWVEEGVDFCAFATQVNGSMPVYRLVGVSDTTRHFFTISAAERDSAVNSGIWKYERIAFYALTAPTTINIRVLTSADNGNITTEGTLSHALNTAGNGKIITFANGVRTITVKGSLPPLAKGAKIQAACSSPVTITGSDPAASADGLTLLGSNYLTGIKLSGFRGRQIILQGTGNHFTCSSFSKV